MKKVLIVLLAIQLVSVSAFAKKTIYKYRKSQQHKFTGGDVMGEAFDPSGSIMNEEHPQNFDYIFDNNVKVIKKINNLSRYVGRSL